ncbi:hypothetical protein [Dokdonella ginsengisoli]|uniref:FG-GAP repeat protein n=1 Tax=Dokdonella ginsengisoli TaxID=363846 RepID=A0ABV9QZ55_9GAMM
MVSIEMTDKRSAVHYGMVSLAAARRISRRGPALHSFSFDVITDAEVVQMPGIRKKSPIQTSWTEQKVSASEGFPRAWLGSAVAISGDVALVGAKNMTVDGRVGQGVVYVYNKIGGAWKEVQRLTASDGAERDQFGFWIALDGDRAMITAPFAAIDGKVWQGAAYFFSKSGGRWVESQKITGSRLRNLDTFGTVVCLSSSRALVSLGGFTRGGITVPYRVIAFDLVHGRSRDYWVERNTLNAPDPDDVTSAFGSSIAINKDVALIGARTATIDGKPGQGAVYVYARRSSGEWVSTTRLTAAEGAPRENFGTSIAWNGVEALVGAQGSVINGNVSQGAVYRFSFERGRWDETQKFYAAEGTSISLFGASVSLAKKRLIVGAYATSSYTGAAYLFVFRQGLWQEVKTLKASDGKAGDLFGYYAALSEKDALVGAFAATVDGNFEQGAAYFFALPSVDAESGLVSDA